MYFAHPRTPSKKELVHRIQRHLTQDDVRSNCDVLKVCLSAISKGHHACSGGGFVRCKCCDGNQTRILHLNFSGPFSCIFEFLYISSAYMADTSGPLWPLQHVASSVKLPGNLKIQAPCARRLHRCFRGYDWSRNLRAVPAGKVSFRRLDLLRLSIFVGPI